jgi:uncharacterized protein
MPSREKPVEDIYIDLSGPWTAADEAALTEFLASEAVPAETMNAVALEGYFAGLAVGPERVPPILFLPRIWGGPPEWRDEAALRRAHTLVMRFYNEVTRKARTEDFFLPRLPLDERGQPVADEWCGGFRSAMQISLEAWKPLLQHPEDSVLLAPVMIPGNSKWNDLFARAPDPGQARAEMAGKIGPCVTAIRNYWRAHVVASPSPSAGRNDLCPCGSGKKFKKCCGG